MLNESSMFSLTGKSANQTSIVSILVTTALLFASGSLSAESPCDPREVRPGIQGSFVLEVVPFEKTYPGPTEDLRLPLANPETAQVAEARFKVVVDDVTPVGAVEEFANSEEDAWAAISGGSGTASGTKSDQLISTFNNGNSPNARAFRQQCIGRVNSIANNTNAERKKIRFVSPVVERILSQSLRYQFAGPCSVRTPDNRQIETKIYYKVGPVSVRVTDRAAGKLESKFRLVAAGEVEGFEHANLNFSTPGGLRVRTVEVPGDVPSSALRIRVAQRKSALEEELQRLRTHLNGTQTPLDLNEQDQQELCGNNRDSSVLKDVAFSVFGGEHMEQIKIQSRYEEEVAAGGLGRGVGGFDCDTLSCDCENYSPFGAWFMDAPLIRACRSEQRAQIEHCHDTGQVVLCANLGPNPNPPRSQ